MNGKDRVLVVEADQRIDVAPRQEMTTQRRIPVVADEPGRQHHAEASAGREKRN